jgi:hypothetical protein
MYSQYPKKEIEVPHLYLLGGRRVLPAAAILQRQ